MCLIALAWKAHPRWPLVLLGNRDENHARPALPLARWPDAPQVLAGRDEQAGGTWMGVNEHGLVAVVTNVRDPSADLSGASRGHLVADYLRTADHAVDHARHLVRHADAYRPFNLLLFDADTAVFIGNHPATRMQLIAPGIHGLSNADFNTPWPKTRALTECLRHWANSGQDDVEPLFDALADDDQWPDDVLPDTGVGIKLERRLSAAFIRGQHYGTRASTLIVVDHDGAGTIIERRFGPEGRPAGCTTLNWNASA